MASVLIFAILAMLAACDQEPLIDPQADLVVYGARVWDGTGTPPTGPSLLQVSNGRVLSLTALASDSRIATAALAAGVPAINAIDRYVVPGLINAHGHVGVTWSEDMETGYEEYVTAELQRYARFGVTTVNSLGGSRDRAFFVRDQSWSAEGIGGARLLVAGPVVTGSTAAQAVAMTSGAAAMGPDWIKIRVDDNLGTTTTMPPEAYRAAIDRAHALNLPLAAHIFYEKDAKELLKAGADLVAHSIRDREVDNETIELFRQTGVCYVPTLTRELSTFVYSERPAFFDDPFFAADADSAQIAVLSDPARQERTARSPRAQAYRTALQVAQRNLKQLSDADAGIAFGTDSGPLGRFQGYFEHLEAGLMAEAGLTPAEILRSATGEAADCLARDDVGTLEPGRLADFIVLREDPLEDIRNLRTIESVWVGGSRIPLHDFPLRQITSRLGSFPNWKRLLAPRSAVSL